MEEEPKSHGKPKKMMMAVIITVLIISLIFLMAMFNPFAKGKSITALNGYSKVEEVISERYGNLTSYTSLVIASGNIRLDGSCDTWDYSVTIEHPNDTYEGFVIRVYYDHTYDFFPSGYTNISPAIVIQDWLIDSDDAYQIAMNNETLKLFINHNPKVDNFQLMTSQNDGSYWIIEWVYSVGYDNPRWAIVNIDAVTGDITHLKVDN